MTSPPDDVYEAAARAAGKSAWLDEDDRKTFCFAVDAGFAAGVAAGRAQAAADIRAQSVTWCMDGTGRHLVGNCAKIAGGEPRG